MSWKPYDLKIKYKHEAGIFPAFVFAVTAVKIAKLYFQVLLMIPEMCIFAKVYEKNTLHIGSGFNELQQKCADPSPCGRRPQQE